jgi:hypothetical protein
MGSSSSSISQQVMNKTLNSTLSTSVTEHVQETSVETLVESAKSCSSKVAQSNSCNLSGMAVGGNFTFGGKQSNEAKVNFSCINSDTAATAMESAATAGVLGELGALNGTEGAAQLNAMAAAASKTGSMAFGGSSDSNVSSNITNSVTNQTESIVKNLFQSHISQHLNSKTVDECIGKTTQKNEMNLSGVKVGGDAKVECNQSNSLESVQECKQLTEAVQKSLTKTAQELGFKVSAENKTASKSAMKSEAKSESVATGPIQDIGNAISGILDGVLGLASLGVAGPFIVICCCVCCCILLSCAGSMMMKSSGGGGSSGSSGFSGSSAFGKMKGLSSGLGRAKGFMGKGGGDSETNSSDMIDYFGGMSIDIISDIISDSSPLFE